MSHKVTEKRRWGKGDLALQLALAQGQTTRDAAAAAGISERTANRRLADACFVAAVDDLRTGLIRQALGVLAAGMMQAAATLQELLNGSSDTIRLGASRALLELGLKMRTAIEIEDRIRNLESSLLDATKEVRRASATA